MKAIAILTLGILFTQTIYASSASIEIEGSSKDLYLKTSSSVYEAKESNVDFRGLVKIKTGLFSSVNIPLSEVKSADAEGTITIVNSKEAVLNSAGINQIGKISSGKIVIKNKDVNKMVKELVSEELEEIEGVKDFSIKASDTVCVKAKADNKEALRCETKFKLKLKLDV